MTTEDITNRDGIMICKILENNKKKMNTIYIYVYTHPVAATTSVCPISVCSGYRCMVLACCGGGHRFLAVCSGPNSVGGCDINSSMDLDGET